MIHGAKVCIVLPAYRAAQTLEKCYQAIPPDLVDDVLMVDDASDDDTVAVAERLGIDTLVHDTNRGYGGNQKTCYRAALDRGADIVVMLHPDYQYDPRLVDAMAAMVASGVYDVVLGSRILGGKARRGGMPFYKYAANRVLTAFQNFVLGSKLSEFHTGFRAFSADALRRLPLHFNSDDFVFDNQMLAQCIVAEFRIGEISCPTRYFDEASSIRLWPSIVYGAGVVWTTLEAFAARLGIRHRRYNFASALISEER